MLLTYRHARTFIHLYCTQIRTHICTYILRSWILTPPHTHTCMHTYSYTFKHIAKEAEFKSDMHTHTHTHTHTYTWSLRKSSYSKHPEVSRVSIRFLTFCGESWVNLLLPLLWLEMGSTCSITNGSNRYFNKLSVLGKNSLNHMIKLDSCIK